MSIGKRARNVGREAPIKHAKVEIMSLCRYAERMGKRREKHPLEDNPFVDDFLEWMGSPEGQSDIEALDILWPLLEKTTIDAKKRKIIWQDGKRLSIMGSVRRIHKEYPDIAPDVIEEKIIGWLETFSPETYSEEQFEELDRLTDQWIDDHERQAEARQKYERTPDS